MSPGDRKALTLGTLVAVLFLAPLIAGAVAYPPQGSGGGGADLSAVAEDVLPSVDSTYDLGSSSKAWAEVWTDKVKSVSGTDLSLATAGSDSVLIRPGDSFTAVEIDAGNMTMSVGIVTNTSGITVRDDGTIVHGTGNDVRQEGELTTLTNNSASTVFSVQTGDGDMAGLVIHYTLQCSDGTEYQSEAGTVTIAIVDDAGGVVASTPGEVSAQALSSGTLGSTWSVVTTDDQSIEVQVTPASSLTTTTCQIRWHAVYSGDVTLSVP